MRSRIYIISLLATLGCFCEYSAWACGEIGGHASEYLLYRVYDKNSTLESRRLIPQLQESDDPEVMEYLNIARTCEAMRTKQNSKWYYPSKNDVVITTLEDVLKKSLEYKGTALKERYALQAARAMFSLGKFEQMCLWWKDVDDQIAPGPIRENIIGYVAGAKYRTGEKEVALQYYVSIGDVASIEYCLRQEGRYNGYRSLVEYCTEYQTVFKDMQHELTKIEVYYDYFSRSKPESLVEYYNQCLETAETSPDPAPWFYTAAFLKYMSGEYYVAQNLLSKAEKSCKTAFMSDSIRVLRILLDAHVSTYNKAYETELLEDLKWLDKMICDNLTDEVRNKTAEDGYYIRSNTSYYYWNDMMRKIVIGTVAPRMVEAGKTPLALLLLNYADNRLISLVDRYHVCEWEWLSHRRKGETDLTMSEYRNNLDLHNGFDYSNHYFKMLNDDKTSISSILEYSKLLSEPSCDLQSFLVERAFVDDDYLNDLIGTRYLRIHKYTDAYGYLAAVSKGYQKRLNTRMYMRRHPFHYNRYETKNPMPDYKLKFTEAMIECEKIMATSSDPEKIGHAKIKYGIGMRNSLGLCWALTNYAWSGYADSLVDPSEELIVMGDSYIKSGLQSQTNPNHCDVLKNYY